MRIADLCRQDTGGQSFKLARAINAYTPHECRSYRRSRDYLQFPVDIQHGAHTPQDIAFLRNADIIHCHGTYHAADGWGRLSTRARWVMHQHGRPGKLMDAWLRADRQRRAHRVVSTLNLLPYVDGDASRWIPAPMNLAELDAIRARSWRSLRRRGGRILVAHSPTRRDYKGTDDIAAAVDTLKRDGLNVHLMLIEGQPHAAALSMKAQCDITYDQMHLCYGNSGLEGMAFGQPTIVGMDAEARAIIGRVVGHEPFVYAEPSTLTDVLRRLVVDADERRRWGETGRRYIETWHEHAVVARRVAGIYERLTA